MSRTYTLTATTYGGRTANRSMLLNTMQPWADKRAGCWKTGSTEYWGAVSFLFDSDELSELRSKTIESSKLSISCSSTFAYSEDLLYNEKETPSATDWSIPNYAFSVTVPRNGTIPIIDVTVFGIPDYGFVIGGYYRTYAYCGITGGTLTVVTSETSKTITYNVNGGSSTPSATEIWGETSWDGNVTSSVPTRNGYQFNGWNTQANGGGTSYAAGASISLTADITLYAQWTALSSVLVSASDANITETTTVTWTNYGTFTNKLRFIFGAADSGEISVSGTSYTYTMPSSWLAQIPNATSGTATVYLYTYVDGVQTGSSSLTFTASVKSDVVPAIGSATATGVDPMWSLLLQGYSSVTIAVSGCTAGQGASISSYSIQGHGLSYSSNSSDASASATSSVFSVSGSLTYTATVTDTRGRSASQSVTVTVTAYAAPNISSVTGVRCNADGTENPITGTTIKTSTNFTWTAVGSNALTSTLSYKKHADQYYTQAQTGLASGSSYLIAVGLAEIASSYDVQVEISDSLGNSATYTIIVPPVVGISFGLKNDRARFGGPCEQAGLQIDWNTLIKGTLTIGTTTITENQLQQLLAML